MNDFFKSCRYCGKDYSSLFRDPSTAKHILLVHEIACKASLDLDECATLPPKHERNEKSEVTLLDMYDEYTDDFGEIHHGF